jgi:hypothetical protein
LCFFLLTLASSYSKSGITSLSLFHLSTLGFTCLSRLRPQIRHHKLASFFAPRLEGLQVSRVSVLERHPRKLVTFSILDLNAFLNCAPPLLLSFLLASSSL